MACTWGTARGSRAGKDGISDHASGCLSVCLSVRCYLILLLWILPDKKSLDQGINMLYFRGRITGAFSLLAYLKCLPCTWRFFME